MAAPIILWNPSSSRDLSSARDIDDAGNTIIRTILPRPPVLVAPSYRACDRTRSRILTGVPKLASFCIRALIEYPEQLHQLGSARLYYDSKQGGTDCILRSVIPSWDTTHFSLRAVDPRLWATIIQIYRNTPGILSTYPCYLSDPHVPLLNQIPCTPDFALLTVLELEGSRNVTDDNILSLKILHNLTALDLGRCFSITARGIEGLSRTLVFNELGERRGPWALRILRMQSCHQVDGRIFKSLHSFPLLSVVDLRGTRCTVLDVERPFFSATEDDTFELPLAKAVEKLSQEHQSMFSTETPFVLSLEEQYLAPTSSRVHKHATTIPSRHNNFVVLPPSQGSTSSGRPKPSQLRFGNVDKDEVWGRRLEREKKHNGDMYHHYPEQQLHWEDDLYDDEMSDQEYSDDDAGLEDWPNDENDSDTELLSALRASVMSRTTDTNAVSSDREQEMNQAERRNGNQTAAPVETFYQRIRTVTPPRRIRRPPNDLALIRVPPVWGILDSLTPRAVQPDGKRKTHSRENVGEVGLPVQRKQKASVQFLQAEVSKRRKKTPTADAPGGINTPRGAPPPPSPASTVCNAGETPAVGRGTPLRPISNLQPPPRSSFQSRPRLKLEARVKPAKTESSGPSAPFPAVAKRRIIESRNMSLAEGFKLQSQKSSGKLDTGERIKPSMTEDGVAEQRSNESLIGREKLTKKDEGVRAAAAKAKATGFDWDRWKKR